MYAQDLLTTTHIALESKHATAISQITQRDQQSQRLPPRVTTSSSSEYAHRCALASSRATLADPLNLAFQAEKFPSKSLDGRLSNEIQQFMYEACLRRLNEKLARSDSAFVAEAGDFAAVACWERENSADALTPDQLSAVEASGRPIFAEFLRKTEHAKAKHLFPICQQYWHLSLMARDPTMPYVSGAVRSVMVPFVQRFLDEECLPVWLEAGSAQARAVYAHFGFRELETVTVQGVSTWCMIRTP